MHNNLIYLTDGRGKVDATKLSDIEWARARRRQPRLHASPAREVRLVLGRGPRHPLDEDLLPQQGRPCHLSPAR